MRLLTKSSIPSSSHSFFLSGVYPSSLTKKMSGFIFRSSFSKSNNPDPIFIHASFTHLSDLIMYSLSRSPLIVRLPLSSLMVRSDPIPTYRSPCAAASSKNATCPECSMSKHPLTKTFFFLRLYDFYFQIEDLPEVNPKSHKKFPSHSFLSTL